MKSIYYIDKLKRKIISGECSSLEDGYRIIDKILKERGYKSYYKRTLEHKDGMLIDFGSHTEFFLIENDKEY